VATRIFTILYVAQINIYIYIYIYIYNDLPTRRPDILYRVELGNVCPRDNKTTKQPRITIGRIYRKSNMWLNIDCIQ